jgi:hypothetical protein
MAKPFSVTAASTIVRLDPEGRGEASFTDSNADGRPRRGRVKLVRQLPAQEGWLKIGGEAERDFPVGGEHQFIVQMAVPAGSEEGRYSFRLDAFDVQDPDESYAQGTTVAFTVAKREEHRQFRWWVVAVVGLVAALGGLSAWLLLSRRGQQSVQGQWNGTATLSAPGVADQSHPAQASLTQNGQQVTGTLTTDQSQPVSGVIQGDKVMLSASNQVALTLNWRVTVCLEALSSKNPVKAV